MEKELGINRSSMTDFKASKILEQTASQTLANPYKRFNYNQYEHMNNNHRSYALLPSINNKKVTLEEDASTLSLANSL